MGSAGRAREKVEIRDRMDEDGYRARKGGRDAPKHLLAKSLLHVPPVLVVEAGILLLQSREEE